MRPCPRFGIRRRNLFPASQRGGERQRLSPEQLFGCQRLARQDWVNGYIDMDRYRVQVLIGMYITFAADAMPAFRKRLLAGIDQLSS